MEVPGTSMTGWTLSWCGQWLPGSYESRDTLLVVIGALTAFGGTERILLGLQERYNRAVPSVDITTERVLEWLAGSVAQN